jgi:hypothetical protein
MSVVLGGVASHIASLLSFSSLQTVGLLPGCLQCAPLKGATAFSGAFGSVSPVLQRGLRDPPFRSFLPPGERPGVPLPRSGGARRARSGADNRQYRVSGLHHPVRGACFVGLVTLLLEDIICMFLGGSSVVPTVPAYGPDQVASSLRQTRVVQLRGVRERVNWKVHLTGATRIASRPLPNPLEPDGGA